LFSLGQTEHIMSTPRLTNLCYSTSGTGCTFQTFVSYSLTQLIVRSVGA